MFAVLFAILATSVIAAPVVRRGKPDGWASGYLEDYDTYHDRYTSLNCHDKHGTDFFDRCCHPLLSTETLADDLKAHCVPDNDDDDSSSDDKPSDDKPKADWAEPKESSSVDSSDDKPQADLAQPKPKESSSSSPSGDVKYGGFATFFYQAGNPGECGTVHSDNDMVIAIDTNGYWPDFSSNSNSPHCGKWINIKNTNNGKTVKAMVADSCPTCVTNNSLDLSVAAFNAIASEQDGQVPIEWSWA